MATLEVHDGRGRVERVSVARGGRTLLRNGFTSVLEGQLSGQVQAKRLDMAFLSGLMPRLRRTGGTLEADVKVAGLLGKPIANGEAHLRKGLFDVVGQGVYEDVGLDATFSPIPCRFSSLTAAASSFGRAPRWKTSTS